MDSRVTMDMYVLVMCCVLGVHGNTDGLTIPVGKQCVSF